MPQLSFVIPALNVEDFVEECVLSTLQLPGDDVEVIVVDNGSTDATSAILGELERKDPRIKVLVEESRNGPGHVRNAGLAAATGDFVWFVDSDDCVPAGAVEKVLQGLTDGVDMLWFDYDHIYSDGRLMRNDSRALIRCAPTQPFTIADWPYIAWAPMYPWNKVVRRSFLNDNNVVFPSGGYEDVYFSVSALLAGASIRASDDSCYSYRSRPGSFSRTPGFRAAFIEVWDSLLGAATAQPVEVQVALTRRMVRNGWFVISAFVPAAERREFFERLANLYIDRCKRMPHAWRIGHRPGHRADVVTYPLLTWILRTRSWGLGRVFVDTRRAVVRTGRAIRRLRA